MKRFLKVGLAGLFFLLLILGGITAHSIIQVQSFGRLINYAGIVRGGTQRLVKLELEGIPDDELISYIDGILKELSGGDGPYQLLCPNDERYQNCLSELNQVWMELKNQIDLHRTGEDNAADLIELSELHFELANHTVFAADEYSVVQTRTLLLICMVMFLVMLLTWIFIFWAAARNMLQLEYTNKKLEDKTKRDALTQAYNLKAFKEMAEELLEGAAPGENYAVVYTDFVDFKYINDVFGYGYGDSILAEYAAIIQGGLREGEILGRVSADNFVVLLRYDKKEEVAARQRAADEKITEYMHNSYDRQSLPTCCGICCKEDVIEELKIGGLLDRANFARKTVKNGTNSNYVYYDESIRRKLRQEKNVESRMHDALEHHEFVVYYQPKVALKTETVECAEALVRWKTVDGMIASPDQFIPVFESKFMIHQLDQYVMEEVCRWLRYRLDKGHKVVPVSVNVSRLQFYDQDFVSRYVAIRNKYQIPPWLIEIEFTESIVFDNSSLLLQIVDELKKNGFSCAIDDFGKGYSSMSMLKNISVDVVKLDGFFFSEGEDRERDQAVVKGIVELVKQFHIHVVAEGVESREQVEFLKQIGCDYVQGYVFYKPMAEEAFGKLLQN